MQTASTALTQLRAINSAVRALALHAGCPGFESLIAHLNVIATIGCGLPISPESACEYRKRFPVDQRAIPFEPELPTEGWSRSSRKGAASATVAWSANPILIPTFSFLWLISRFLWKTDR